MPNRKHKVSSLIFSILLCLYIGTVLFLCFARFDPEFIQEESQLFNLTDKDVHFIMFIPFVPLCFLAFGNSSWKWGWILLFALGLVIVAGGSAWVIELLQSTTEYRGYDIWDAVAGVCGAAAGALLLLPGTLIARLVQRKKASGNRKLMMFLLLLLSGNSDLLCANTDLFGRDSDLLCANIGGYAGKQPDYREETDSLIARMETRRGVRGKPVLKKALRRSGKTDFYFSREMGDYPWHAGDIDWLRSEIRRVYSGRLGKFTVGEIFAAGRPVSSFVTPELGFDGHPVKSPGKIKNPDTEANVVRRLDFPEPQCGLAGRNIALWQSHGYYYEPALDRWEWQRAGLFRTVEDIFTQSFVTQFLAPMLENAGAYVMMPRERDLNPDEYIVDNDPGCSTSRTAGSFTSEGRWSTFGKGFADVTEAIADTLNPFLAGTSLKSGKRGDARAEWTAQIRKEGDYAVYVSYRSFPESSENAHYSIYHSGGSSDYMVNQKMGGGTWIYLGTFHFGAGSTARVSLSAGEGGGILSADAVRIGGGRGNIARGPAEEISGLPRSLEGSRYCLQWYGAPQKIWHPWNEEENDYRDDYSSRGLWTGWVSGGSSMNRKEKGLGIPLDLALAFHTDAGTALRDSTVGTLVLYSSSNEGNKLLPSGEKMATSREFAELVQSQVVNDIRTAWNPEWRRRETKDRAYMETRGPACPSMILELLSHQNFNDMKAGLDPGFRFLASRAVYKGILKYLSNRYGVDYVVQPLPVESFEARVEGDEAVLSWVPRQDSIEPTAVAEKYMIETRKEGCPFTRPQFIDTESVDGRICCRVRIGKGEILSFRVSAWNRGGKSFPSEVLSVGRAAKPKGKVLIVNNFDRVSAPVHFEDSLTAGFNAGLDSGVDYLRCINYVGEMYEFRRDLKWTDDDCPGFGASFTDCAALHPAGNSFDYPYIHGQALLALGYDFDSSSAAAFCSNRTGSYTAIDLICGKQASTPAEGGRIRYAVFPGPLCDALESCGCPLIVSGSYIGSDSEGGIFKETAADGRARRFTSERLGFRLMNCRASRRGTFRWTGSSRRSSGRFNTEYSEEIYRVESPDGIVPANAGAHTIMRYSDSGISAAVAYKGKAGKTVSFGFPIETVEKKSDLEEIFRFCLSFFDNSEEL